MYSKRIRNDKPPTTNTPNLIVFDIDLFINLVIQKIV